MGDNASNATLLLHVRAGQTMGATYRHHHGSLGIDTATAEVDPSTYGALHNAAVTSQSSWEGAMPSAVGSAWWAARPQVWRDDAWALTKGATLP